MQAPTTPIVAGPTRAPAFPRVGSMGACPVAASHRSGATPRTRTRTTANVASSGAAAGRTPGGRRTSAGCSRRRCRGGPSMVGSARSTATTRSSSTPPTGTRTCRTASRRSSTWPAARGRRRCSGTRARAARSRARCTRPSSRSTSSPLTMCPCCGSTRRTGRLPSSWTTARTLRPRTRWLPPTLPPSPWCPRCPLCPPSPLLCLRCRSCRTSLPSLWLPCLRPPCP
mmetsp:Transcript_34314/g.81691  ORF Transcript_34314/g.81691 Transcript_34314/m.81691 type:complete len:227 (+) Transcript_34314:542-1222(+)